MIVCSPARTGDAAALAALHATAFARGWSRDEFAALLAAPECFGFLARRGAEGCLAGFVIARVAADEAEILTIAVAAKHRRRGVARATMKVLLDRLSRARVATLFLEVGTGNGPAQRLYRGLGFTPVGRRPGYYGTGERGDAAVLRAALAPPGDGFKKRRNGL